MPSFSSRTPAYSAASDEPHAASIAMFGPPRLNRFATRPAATFSRMPGNESSVHSGRMPSPSSMISCRLDRHAGDRVQQRHAGPEAVGDGERHPAAADAEDGAGPFAVERPVEVAGVAERLVDRFEQQQLQRLDVRDATSA